MVGIDGFNDIIPRVLEKEVGDLMQAVSHAYARGRFKTYTG